MTKNLKRIIAVVFASALAFAANAAQHPMDPLSADELAKVKTILREAGKADDSTRYPLITLLEPPKSEVLRWRKGADISRRARVVVRQGAEVFAAEVDLSAGKLGSWREIKNRQSSVMFEEWAQAQELAVADSRLQKALTKRGMDLEKVICVPASQGYFGQPEEEGRRLFKVYCLDQRPSVNNTWAWPIEGLYAIVDLGEKRVLRVYDSGVIPVAPDNHNFTEADVGELRPALKPVLIFQPKGANYRIDGNVVEWQKWRFHVRADRRLGAVISNVTYNDKGKPRQVLYQGYMSEMFVPYNDPDFGWFSRTYFDVGEYGLGLLASILTPGVDCPQSAKYLPFVINDDEGNALEIPNALCIFERNTGNPSWRHAEFLNETFEGRPQVELVVRFAPQVGNYDYIIDWVFNQAGELDGRVGATGIDALKGVKAKSMSEPGAKAETKYGMMVAPNLVATYHDHHFNFRLDLDVDGADNHFIRNHYAIEELPKDHPRRAVYVIREDIPKTEKQGRYSAGKTIQRFRVASDSAKNRVGNPTSYEVVPHGRAAYILPESEWYSKRAGFMRHMMWVTPHSPEERYASGDFVFAGRGDDGLAVWSEKNRNIKNTDIVVWVNIGMNHFTRSEDAPVLPIVWRTFKLRPFNFFDRNPALDLRTKFAE